MILYVDRKERGSRKTGREEERGVLLGVGPVL